MKQVGIWLDQKEANIITLLDKTQNYKTIYSDIETRERYPGETKQFGRFGEQYMNNEKGKKNKIDEMTNRYLHTVVKNINNADEILIFGPAQTKTKLEKQINEDPKLSLKLSAIKNSDNMTENQKIAYVKDYFKSDK